MKAKRISIGLAIALALAIGIGAPTAFSADRGHAPRIHGTHSVPQGRVVGSGWGHSGWRHSHSRVVVVPTIGFGLYSGWGYWGGYYPPYYRPYYPYAGYYPPYYSPYYYPPAAVAVPSSPPVYVERGATGTAPADAPASWYYCAEFQGYYPYVKECPGGWQRVPAAPAEPR